MGKLSLKGLNLEYGNLLQKEELRTIFGGYSDVGCYWGDWCNTAYDCRGIPQATCSCTYGTCGD